MPEHLKLNEFGHLIWAAFGAPPYHVGSSLTEKAGWRDVDVRLILSDDVYAEMGLGDPLYPMESEKWISLVLAYTALGRTITGLPIDFQIQQQTLANKQYDAPRSALGLVPHRMKRT